MPTEKTEKAVRVPDTDHRPAAYTGPPKDEVVTLRQQYLTPGLLRYYREPLLIVEGHMQYVWDETGKQYLDAFAGVVTISAGHCHPDIIQQVRAQAKQLQHTTTLYLHPTVGQLGKALAEHMPADSGLSVSYFTNSGSEANEIALLSAREFTGHADALSLRNSYHGSTQGAMSMTAIGTWKFGASPAVNIKHATPGYCYRCPYGLEYPDCDIKCARDVEMLIRHETSGQVACFIGEPIQGVGGAVTPPPEYFQIVYDIVRQHGGLCIADEVQTGFGRTGEHYWGFENWGVVPDLVTMAKGLGNGAPIAACVTRPEIAEVMSRRIHFNTFGGNPMTATQGLATLEVLDRENYQENARVVGTYLKQRLMELQEKHALIGEIRGLGLMLGVELVKDRSLKQPASDKAVEIQELARDRGLLLGKGGLHGNTLRIKPPLCISKDDANFIADCLDEILADLQHTHQ